MLIQSFRFVLMIALLVCSGGCSSSDSKAGAGKKAPLQFPVEVQTIAVRHSELVVRAVGSVEPFEIVPVTARVGGTVESVDFQEGETVRAGDALVRIELDRYQLALKSAEAAFEKSKASLREIQAGLERRIDIQLKNPGFVSSEELENWQTRADGARADSASADASLQLAKLNFRDANVPAPVAGVIQKRIVRTGQFLQAGTVVATIVRREPLLLKFSIPVREARALRQGQNVVFFVDGEKDTLRAVTTAVSESADSETRMIEITAQVSESSSAGLQSGVFAEVAVFLGESKRLPVIPQISIRPSEKGFLAFVVADSVAKERVLKLGLQTHDGMVEVQEGLEEGEILIVRGAEALSDGASIRIVDSKTEEAGSPDSQGAKL